MTAKLPGARADLNDGGPMRPEFYRFFSALELLQAGSASAADLAAINAQLVALQAEINALPEGSFPKLLVTAPVISSGLLQNGLAILSLKTANSVDQSTGALQFVNDISAPGNTFFYGTGLTGAKGWQALGGVLHGTADDITATVNADGSVTFDLAAVANSGEGTLQAITRDGLGRITGTKAATITPGASGNITVVNGDASAGLPTIDLADAVTQPATNTFFGNGGAHIQRLNDRVFIGGATQASGNFPQTTNDWWSDFEADLLGSASAPSMLFASTNNATASASAITGAAQSLNFTAAGTSCIGIMGVAVNNNATLATNAWGIYAEAHRTTSAAGGALGIEVDVRTLASAQAPTPYGQGTVTGLQIGAGGGVSATGQFNPSTAIEIIDNPMQWQAGIVFNDTALAGTNGIAMALAKGHTLQWYSDATTLTGALRSVGDTGINAPLVEFADSAINIRSISTSVIQHVLAIDDATTSHLLFRTGNASSWPELSSQGAATNINLSLSPKGSGSLILPNTSALEWRNGSTALSFIQCAATGSGETPIVNLADGQIQFKSSGVMRYQIIFNSGDVNFLQTYSAASGGAPRFQAAGADANIDLIFSTKGTGLMRFGTFTATAPAATGYITIRDAAGNTRKLLCA